MGPTASGKTALAIELYQTRRFEIVSVDSAMVYQQMDIGSAKPSAEELKDAPHHLIDFIDPADAYSASSFVTDARQLIGEIQDRGKVPLLTGGTMLYFKALRDGLADLPGADAAIREQLNRELNASGIEYLHSQLKAVDPFTAERLHTTDTQRILRALEVYRISDKPISAWHQDQKNKGLNNPILSIALAPTERSLLHQRIALRFAKMMDDGFLEEVKKLHQRSDLDLNCPSMRSVGYRQIWQFLDGELTLEEAVERAIIATRQLAKRQYTWLRSWEDLHWFDSLEPLELSNAKSQILAFISEDCASNSHSLTKK